VDRQVSGRTDRQDELKGEGEKKETTTTAAADVGHELTGHDRAPALLWTDSASRVVFATIAVSQRSWGGCACCLGVGISGGRTDGRTDDYEVGPNCPRPQKRHSTSQPRTDIQLSADARLGRKRRRYVQHLQGPEDFRGSGQPIPSDLVCMASAPIGTE